MDKSNVTQLHPKGDQQKEEASLVTSLSPREIVSELDRFVVGPTTNLSNSETISLGDKELTSEASSFC